MFDREVVPAHQRLADAIQFRQMGGGYWQPDTLTDRNAMRLSGVTYRPSRDPDAVLQQFSGVCFCQFNTPPLGRRMEAERLVTAYRQRQAQLDAKPEWTEADHDEYARITAQLDELRRPDADTLDRAAEKPPQRASLPTSYGSNQ
jgi:hypothetical protein